jgi:hypothetical protein
MPSQSTTRSRSRSVAPAKVRHPGKMFAEPAHVIADPDLTTDEKRRALDVMEQDARQLAVATAEGMDGGEETRLREILQAKQILEMPPVEMAFSVVRQTFEAKLRETLGTATHELIGRALDAIKVARDAIAESERAPPPPPGAPAPGSTKELEEELDKEQLDP